MVEISLPNKPKWKIPIIPMEKQSAITPVESHKLHGIKFAPRLQGRKVILDVYAVIDSLEGVTNCEQMKSLKTKLVASYSGYKGDTIKVSSLKRFSIAPFAITVTTQDMEVDDDYGGSGCCICGDLACCPHKGQCLTCSNCGICCRTRN